ncbi:MAG: ubiquinone biosynthesis accessory factor UbiJ [Halothiobacillus sp.]
MPLLLLIERALNHHIARDPSAAPALRALQGRLFEVLLRDPALRLSISITPEGVLLLRDTEDMPDATLRASSWALLRASQAAHKMDALFTGDIQIEGDQAAAQQFLRLLVNLDSDPFALLAERVGAAPAGLIERKVEQMRAQAAIWRRTRQIEAADFLIFERALLTERPAMQQWLDAVDTLRDEVDSLAARIERLAAAHPNSPAPALRDTP